MDNNKFSILTASHNYGLFIEDWALSILKQKYRPLEVVFVDDFSEDNTQYILNNVKKDFTKNNIELKIIKNKYQLFCGSSYKKAFINSSGYFFGILDSDDVLKKKSVDFIMELYKKNLSVGWIYTQFDICDINLVKKRKGFSSLPEKGLSLLDCGFRKKHCYSHWRTFSKRCPDLMSIWKDGLKCSVDKYMGYRLEELCLGGYSDRICYSYRNHKLGSIKRKEKSIETWDKVKKEVKDRRENNDIKTFKIIRL